MMRAALYVSVCLLASTASAQYAGPAILSRGDAPAAMKTPEIDFRPYAEIQGGYDGGLQGVSLTTEGKPRDEGAAGVMLRWGISGTHSWRHTKLGLDYRGSATHYGIPSYDTIDQALLLGASHQFSPHTLLTLRESAGIFGRNFQLPGLSQTVPFDPMASYIPSVDYFDNRTIYATSQADFTIQRSTRLVYNVGGDAFLTERRSHALAGARGASARGDVEYRLSRRTSIGLNYTYAHYVFTSASGGTDLHGLAVSYSSRLTRNVEFSGYGGVMRVESKFISSEPVDPVVAAVLGVTSTLALVHTIDYQPNFAGRLSKRFSTGIAYLSGGHTVTPGNGLFLTSYATTVTAGYTYTGLRRWSFTAGASYLNAQSAATITGNYGTATASLGFSRQLSHSIHLVFDSGARKYTSGDFSGYNRLVFFAHGGIGITPGSLPFRLW